MTKVMTTMPWHDDDNDDNNDDDEGDDNDVMTSWRCHDMDDDMMTMSWRHDDNSDDDEGDDDDHGGNAYTDAKEDNSDYNA